jgi:hypothetical protein
MRWTPGGTSNDVEDRRGSSGGFGGFGGGGMRIGLGGALVLLVLSLIFKQNFFALLSGGADAGTPSAAGPVASTPEEDKEVQFVSFVLDDAQATWERLFQARGKPYEHAKLVLFRDAIQSACGFAQTASGPFYCPGDEKIYIDLGFYDELKQRFGAPGDFAQAYVLRRPATQSRGGEPALRAPRAPSRLLRRRLGPRDRAAQHPRPGRRGRRPPGRGRRGGRPDSEDVGPGGHARGVHARLVGAARELVPARV